LLKPIVDTLKSKLFTGTAGALENGAVGGGVVCDGHATGVIVCEE